MYIFSTLNRLSKMVSGFFGLLGFEFSIASHTFDTQWFGSKPSLTQRNKDIRLDKVLENQYMAMHCRWLFNLESTNK